MGSRLRRGNVPAEVSGFVGRRRELAELRRLLDVARLVTLTGPGGVGKTRLGLRLAGQSGGFRDGVWLVELADVADPALVPSAVAGVLGVPDRPARTVASTLVDYLATKQVLLVVDNCEHLTEECAALVGRLLAAVPELRVLATSQQPMGLPGEQVVVVAPLPTPDPSRLPPGDLSEFAAVELFRLRAGAVQRTFEVTAGNRTAVAAICSRLDGLPLAIELAAVWLRVLSAEQILTRLDDLLRDAKPGNRATPARHRTLRATLDWSYRLCTDAERVLWTRLSVFAGGFDLAAAEHVAAGDGIAPADVVTLVAALLDKSILVRADGPGDAARYAMLTPVREYSSEQLAACGQQAPVLARHRDYYRCLAQRAQAERVSAQEVRWLQTLQRELPNLRLAMETALGQPDTAHTALQIAVAAQDLWVGGGRYQEGQQWLARALAADPRPSPVRAVGLALTSSLTMMLGDTDAGGPLLAQAQDLADRLADRCAQATVALQRSARQMWVPTADPGRALALAEHALGIARDAGNRRLLSLLLLHAATITVLLGDERAEDYADQLCALGENNRAAWTAAWGSVMLALARWRHGDRRSAAALAAQALPAIRAVRDSWGAGTCLAVLAWNAAAAGDHPTAARLLGACHTIRERAGTPLIELGLFADYHATADGDVRRVLGPAAYTAAVDEGACFTLDEAVDYGLRGATSGAVSPRPADGPLTPREQQIAGLLADGLSNKDIAERLVISQRTAESHIQHILAKLGFTSRAQIAAWATARYGEDRSPASR